MLNTKKATHSGDAAEWLNKSNWDCGLWFSGMFTDYVLRLNLGNGSTMLGGCFAYLGSGNIHHLEGKKDSTKYHEMNATLYPVRMLKLGHYWMFQKGQWPLADLKVHQLDLYLKKAIAPGKTWNFPQLLAFPWKEWLFIYYTLYNNFQSIAYLLTFWNTVAVSTSSLHCAVGTM